MKFFALVLYVALCSSLQMKADAIELSSRGILQTFLADLAYLGAGSGEFFSAPLQFSTNDWLASSATMLEIAAVMHSDTELRGLTDANHSSLAEHIFRSSKIFGERYVVLFFAGAVYSTGLLAGDDYIRKSGRTMLASLLYAGLMTAGIKVLAGRSRPRDESSAFRFQPWQLTNSRQSFPSGHTSTAFALASAMAGQCESVWGRCSFYGIAALTGLSRMYDGEHWASDVLLGALIGTLAGNFANSSAMQSGPGRSGMMDRLKLSPTGSGLQLAWTLF